MLTIKQEDKLLDRIKNLPEIEFISVMKELSDHIYKNKWDHIIDECFDIDDYGSEMKDLEEDNERLEKENEDLAEKLVEVETLCERGLEVEEYEDGAFEKVSKILNEIKDL